MSINGNISCKSSVENAPEIVPFWVERAASGVGSFYFEETTDKGLKARAQFEINLAYDGSFMPTSLFIATWVSDGTTHTTKVFIVIIILIFINSVFLYI